MSGPIIWGPGNKATCLAPGGIVGIGTNAAAAASAVSYIPSGVLVSTDVQSALDEIAQKTDSNFLNYSWLFDDMIMAGENTQGYGQLCLEPTGSNGGGIFTPSNFAGSLAGRFGVVAFGNGTNSNSTANGCCFNDYAVMYAGQNLSTTLYFGVYVPSTLSDGTNYYILDLGFRNSIATGNAANSMTVRYDQGTSAQWMAYASNNSSVTTATSLSSALTVTAGAYWNCKITIASGTVSFFAGVSGSAYTLIGTITSNLPNSAHASYLGFMIFKNASYALQRIMGLDYVGLLNVFSTAR